MDDLIFSNDWQAPNVEQKLIMTQFGAVCVEHPMLSDVKEHLTGGSECGAPNMEQWVWTTRYQVVSVCHQMWSRKPNIE